MDSAEASQPTEQSAEQAPATTEASDTHVSDTPVTADAQAAADTVQPTELEVDGERMLTVPVSAFKRLKDEARTKGRTEAMDELTTRLQALAKQGGFDSIESAFGALAKLNAGANTAGTANATTTADTEATAGDDPPEPPTEQAAEAKAKPARQSAVAAAADKIDADWAKERERLRRRLDSETENRKALEARIAANEAANELRVAAVKAGVEDVEFAMHLAGKYLSSADDAALAEFKAAAWFESLRKERPALFAAQRRTIDTGNTRSDEDGATLSPEEAARAHAEANKTDANSMSREAFNALLAARGLRQPTVGTPLA